MTMFDSLIILLPDTKMLESTEVKELGIITLCTTVVVFDREAMKLHLLAVMAADKVGLSAWYNRHWSGSDPLDSSGKKNGILHKLRVSGLVTAN